MDTVDFDAIRRCAYSRVFDPILREDVAQTACLYAMIHRTAKPWQYVYDAIRKELGRVGTFRRSQMQLVRPDWLASHYPTPEQLMERWEDEENEDQADEFSGLTPAEKDARISESMWDLGSSLVHSVGSGVEVPVVIEAVLHPPVGHPELGAVEMA